METKSTSPWAIWLPLIILSAALSSAATWYVFAGPTTANGQQAEQAGEEADPGMAGGMPPSQVMVGTIIRDTRQSIQELTGRLREIRRASVASEVEGKIIEIPVDVGDDVQQDKTVLARIDGVWADLDLKADEASIRSIEVSLEQARRDLLHLEKLRETRSAVEKEVEDQRSEVQALEAELKAAEARRNRSLKAVERIEVRAPFNGRVTAKHAEIGEWAEIGADLVEIVSSGQIDAVIDVPEQLVSSITLGQQVEVIVETQPDPITGKIIAISPDAANLARTYPVKIRMDDLQGRLLSGMSVIARIPTGKPRSVLLAPRDAVQFSTGTPTIWVGLPGESEEAMPFAMPVLVRILFPSGENYAVEPIPGGPEQTEALLKEGAMVVTQGAEWLAPTQPLIPIPDSTPSEKQGG